MVASKLCDVRFRRMQAVTITRKRLLGLLLAILLLTVFAVLATLFTDLSIVQLQLDRSRDSPKTHARTSNNLDNTDRFSAQRLKDPPRQSKLEALFDRPVHQAVTLSDELYAAESNSKHARSYRKDQENYRLNNRRSFSRLTAVNSLKMNTGEDAAVEVTASTQEILISESVPKPIYRDDTMHRLVHIDLKGAPPKLPFFREFFSFIKKLGATGILIEYEDMFPFTGILRDVSALNHYSRTDIKQILHFARENKLEIIPLVQTFGHMEYILKLEKFQHLREEPLEPSSICPSKPESFDLIRELIDQIISIHNLPSADASAPTRYLHIGADEVWHLAKDQACRDRIAKDPGLTPTSIFLAHVKRVAEYVKQKYPNITVIMWDDMFHTMDGSELKSSGIGDLVEPMVWSYYITWDRHLSDLDQLYPSVFPRIWGATAFKGSTGETVVVPNVTTHALIHTSWLQALSNSARLYNRFQGIVLTGWQRYNHFSSLCELLPVSMPSLAVSLEIVRTGCFDSTRTLTNVARQLECTQQVAGESSWLERDPLLNTFSACKFPGSRVNDAVRMYNSWHEKFRAFATSFIGHDGVITPFHIQHAFASPIRLMQKKPELEQFRAEYVVVRQELSRALNTVFDKYTVDEVLHLYMDDSAGRVLKEIDRMFDAASRRTSWARRPLNFDELGGSSNNDNQVSTDADAGVLTKKVRTESYNANSYD